MNYIYDKKYPVTSILLILTTLVFVGMLILRGFSYAEEQTVFEFGAVFLQPLSCILLRYGVSFLLSLCILAWSTLW